MKYEFMSYQVLARKWRPQTFADVVGQEHVLTVLANSLKLGRVHHAYLFSGTRGVGKTTIARLLTKGLNCENGITATPCGQCNNCCEIKQGRFVDLIEIDAASRTKVEDIRELLDNVQYSPARGRLKVYIIDEVHMLSRYSFNALLKTLEEPPAHVKFLLATTDPQKLPVTIISRCLRLHLHVINVEQIRSHLSMVLEEEHISAEPLALQLLACSADGSMRDALSLTDQAIAMGHGAVTMETVSLMLGTLNTEQPLALIEALVVADGGLMMAQLAQCAACGINWENLLLEMISLLHRIAMLQIFPDQLNDGENLEIVSRLRELACHLPPADLQLYYQTLLIGRKELPFVPNSRMGVEMTLLRALAFHPTRVDAVVMPSRMKKKTAEFNISASQGRHSSGACIGLGEDLTEVSGCSEPYRAETKCLPCLKWQPFSAPKIINLLAESDMAINCHKNIGNLTLFERMDNSYRSCSVAACQWTVKQIEVESTVCVDNDSTAINSTENLVQSYADSHFSFDDYDEVQVDWELDTLERNNTSQLGITLPNSTDQLLQVRTSLLRLQKKQRIKKYEPVPTCQEATVSAWKQLPVVGKRAQQRQFANCGEDPPGKASHPDEYCSHAPQQLDDAMLELINTLIVLPTAQEHEKTPKLALCLEKELIKHDSWAAQVHRLVVPKLVQQLALNSWKEDLAPGKVCLHLRASQRHLNSTTTQRALQDALSADLGLSVELTVTEDYSTVMKTPLEWCQVIYEEKLICAREAIMADSHIKMLRHFFDAELDEDSIQPI